MLKYLSVLISLALLYAVWFRDAPVPDTAIPMMASVRDLLQQPGKFEGRRVRVAGIVARRLTVAGYGGYELAEPDGSATIFVATSRTPAAVGAATDVIGRFGTLLTAGTLGVMVIRETG